MLRIENLSKVSDKVGTFATMPRSPIDTETEELYRSKPWRSQKSVCHRQTRHSMPRGESCSRCEQRCELEAREIARRKRKIKNHLQHCPSCHCAPDFAGFAPVKSRNSETVEAVLKRYEHMLADPSQNSAIRKSQSSPLSPRSTSQTQRQNHSHCPRKSVRRQQRPTEQDEVLAAMLRDVVNSGLANEGVQPLKSKKDGRWRNLPPADVENSSDSDSPRKYLQEFPEAKNHQNDSRGISRQYEKIELPRTNEVAKGATEEREEWRKVLERDCEELQKLEFEIREYEKMKEVDRVKDAEENLMGEKRKSNEVEEEKERPRGEKRSNFFASKLPVAKFNGKPPSGLQNLGVKIKNPECKIEASTSYHRITLDKDDRRDSIEESIDYSKDDQLQKELDSIPYCTPCRRSSKLKNTAHKPEEETIEKEEVRENFPFERIKEKNENINCPTRTNILGGGDLDLHASKSHILGLIDRALSKEFGNISDGRKTRQDMCVEFQSLANHRVTPDYVKQLKVLRWEYLNHIQEELKKLYNLEMFLDTCSPRHNCNENEQRMEQEEQPVS